MAARTGTPEARVEMDGREQRRTGVTMAARKYVDGVTHEAAAGRDLVNDLIGEHVLWGTDRARAAGMFIAALRDVAGGM